MDTPTTTEKVIEDLLASPYLACHDARSRYLLRESLYSLVRLAKAEQMLEIKSSVVKLTGISTVWTEYAVDTDDFQAEDTPLICIQQQFEFQDPE